MLQDTRTPLKDGDEITIGRVKYKIKGECARGGNSLVYIADVVSDGLSSRSRAIKEFYPQIGAERKNGRIQPASAETEALFNAARNRFEREKGILNALSDENPQVPYYFESTEDAGYGVSAKMPSAVRTLSEWSKCRSEYTQLEWIEKCFCLAKSILWGLGRIHEKGFLHLDLSLSNVLCYDENDYPVAFFIDFGSAIEIDKDSNAVTIDGSDGSSYPTRGFAAPERYGVKKETKLYPSTDLFSVGAILLRLISGSDFCDVTKVCIQPYRIRMLLNTLQLHGGVLRELTAFFQRAVNKEACDRFASANEMNNAVDVCLDVLRKVGFHLNTIAQFSRAAFNKKFNSDSYSDALLSPTFRTLSYTSNTILVGPGGAGKTTILFKLWEDLLNRYDQGQDVPIPIWISLSEYDGGKSPDTFIRHKISLYTENVYGLDDTTYIRQTEAFLKSNRVILLLDGINEAIHGGGIEDELKKPCFSNCIVFITSRSTINVSSFWKRFQNINVQELEAETVEKLCMSWGIEYKKLPKRLTKTLLRPMPLALFLRLIKDDSANPEFEDVDLSRINTTGEIMIAHLKRLVNNSVAEHSIRRSIVDFYIWALLPKIAHMSPQMHMSKKAAIENVQKAVVELWKEDQEYCVTAGLCLLPHGNDIIVKPDVVSDFFEQTCIPMGLIVSTKTGYSFAHENYLDFFEAMYIKREMDSSPDGVIPTCLIDSSVPLSGRFPANVEALLGDICGEYEFESKDSVQSPCSPIENWLKRHAQNAWDNRARIAVMRLIEVMKVSRNNNVTADYSYLDLSASNFYDSILPGSCFRGSKIDDDTFIAKGHNMDVEAVSLCSDKYLVTADSEGMVMIWELTTHKCVHEYNLGYSIPERIYDIGANQFAVVCYGNGKTFLFSLFEDTPQELFSGFGYAGFQTPSCFSTILPTKKQIAIARSDKGIVFVDINHKEIKSIDIDLARGDTALVLEKDIAFIGELDDTVLVGFSRDGVLFTLDTYSSDIRILGNLNVLCVLPERNLPKLPEPHMPVNDASRSPVLSHIAAHTFQKGLIDTKHREVVIAADTALLVLDIRSLVCKKVIPYMGSDDTIFLAWKGSTSDYAYRVSYQSVYLIDTNNNNATELFTVADKPDMLICADYCPRYGAFVTGTHMHKVILWDAASGAEIWRHDNKHTWLELFSNTHAPREFWINYDGSQIARVFRTHRVLIDLQENTITGYSAALGKECERNNPDPSDKNHYIVTQILDKRELLSEDYGKIRIYLLDNPEAYADIKKAKNAGWKFSDDYPLPPIPSNVHYEDSPRKEDCELWDSLLLLYEVHVPFYYDSYVLSEDGKRIMVRDYKNDLLLYDCMTGKCIFFWEGISAQDIIGSDFSEAALSDDLLEALKANGSC